MKRLVAAGLVVEVEEEVEGEEEEGPEEAEERKEDGWFTTEA